MQNYFLLAGLDIAVAMLSKSKRVSRRCLRLDSKRGLGRSEQRRSDWQNPKNVQAIDFGDGQPVFTMEPAVGFEPTTC
jgi:hypothetical protein